MSADDALSGPVPAATGAARAVLGVDGCPGGWIGALLDTVDPVDPSDPVERRVRWLALPSFADLVAVPAAMVAIDIPIGLAAGGPRRCDVEARTLLKPRGSSVFPAPVRAVLDASSYAEACALSRDAHADNKAISLQTWGIVTKILEVDRLMTPALQSRVREVHPELAFRTLAAAVLPPKTTAAGRAARAAALAGWLGRPVPKGWVRPAHPNDAFDALACAWVAERMLDGTAVSLPHQPEYDARGLRMEIVCGAALASA